MISIILCSAGCIFLSMALYYWTMELDRVKKDLEEFSKNVGDNLHRQLKMNMQHRQNLTTKIELLESEIREIHNLMGTAPGQPLTPEEVRDLFRKAINEDGNVESLESRKRVRPRQPKRPKPISNQNESNSSGT